MKQNEMRARSILTNELLWSIVILAKYDYETEAKCVYDDLETFLPIKKLRCQAE